MKKPDSRSGLVVRSILDAEYPRVGVLFSWREVADILRLHEQSVRRLIAAGTIKRSPKIIGHNAVTREDLIAFILAKCGRDIDRASYFVQEVEAAYRAHEERLSAVYGSTDGDGGSVGKIN